MKKILCVLLLMISISSFGQVNEFYQTCIKRLSEDGDVPAQNFRYLYEDKMKMFWKNSGWKDEIISVKHVYVNGSQWFIAVKSKRTAEPFYAEYFESGMNSMFIPIKQLYPKRFQQFVDSLDAVYEKQQQITSQQQKRVEESDEARRQKVYARQDSVLLLYWKPIAKTLKTFFETSYRPILDSAYNSTKVIQVKDKITEFKKHMDVLLDTTTLWEEFYSIQRNKQLSNSEYKDEDQEEYFTAFKAIFETDLYNWIDEINKLLHQYEPDK